MGVPFHEHAPAEASAPAEEGTSCDSEDAGDEDWHPSDGSDDDEEWEDPSEGGVLTLVLRAAEHGDEAELEQLLSSLSVPVDTRGADGDTALHLAALYGHVGCARALLRHGADAARADEDGAVPLHDAAAGGHAELVQVLLDAEPECMSAADVDGDTPLHNAARGGFADVVKLLIERGADCRAVNHELRRPDELALPGSEAAHVLEAAAAVGEAEAEVEAPSSSREALAADRAAEC